MCEITVKMVKVNCSLVQRPWKPGHKKKDQNSYCLHHYGCLHHIQSTNPSSPSDDERFPKSAQLHSVCPADESSVVFVCLGLCNGSLSQQWVLGDLEWRRLDAAQSSSSVCHLLRCLLLLPFLTDCVSCRQAVETLLSGAEQSTKQKTCKTDLNEVITPHEELFHFIFHQILLSL